MEKFKEQNVHAFLERQGVGTVAERDSIIAKARSAFAANLTSNEDGEPALDGNDGPNVNFFGPGIVNHDGV